MVIWPFQFHRPGEDVDYNFLALKAGWQLSMTGGWSEVIMGPV